MAEVTSETAIYDREERMSLQRVRYIMDSLRRRETTLAYPPLGPFTVFYSNGLGRSSTREKSGLLDLKQFPKRFSRKPTIQTIVVFGPTSQPLLHSIRRPYRD